MLSVVFFVPSRSSSGRVLNWAFHLLYPLLLLFVFFVLTPAKSVGYYSGRAGSYQDYFNGFQRAPKAYHMPKTNSGKIKVFFSCKPECKNKCEHSIYESRYNTKGQCHKCIRECMSATTQQANYIGIDFGAGKNRRMLRDDPYSKRRPRRKRKQKSQIRPAVASSSLASVSESRSSDGQSVMKNYFTS